MLTLATAVNLLALSAALWLGFYVVTRSPRSPVSWLAALTLWSIASFFLHNAVAINVPGSDLLPWLRRTVVLGLPLWFHLTLLLLPGEARWWRWTLSPTVRRLIILLAYGLALAVIAGGVVPGGLSSDAKIGTAAYLAGRTSGPRYPLAVLFLALWVSLSLINLWQGRSQARDGALRRRFAHLLIATTLASLGILYVMLGVWLRWDLLTLPGDVALGAGVLLLGYAVARYNALVQARTIGRDFVYASLAVGLLTLVYYLAALALYFGGHLSFLALMLVVAVAISSHALYDGLRAALDRLFYREQFRQLRADLRGLAREAGTGQALPDQLQAVLDALCRTLSVQRGLVALREKEHFVIQATRRAGKPDQTLPAAVLSAAETVEITRPNVPALEGMALLVPLCAGGVQVGALVLGPAASGRPYDEGDLALVDDLADQLATLVHVSRLQETNAHAIGEMVAQFRERERALQRQVQQMLAERKAGRVDDEAFRSLVEDGLRRLHDFSYLGEHDLAKLYIVGRQLAGQEEGFVTHLDRGKALHEVLLQALQKLRPAGDEPAPHSVPPREWHPFIILHDAYVLGERQRDIMSRLYVSEGTFNRTRRRAIRGVSKALQEMEREVIREA